jgi:hypothetical protein
MIQGEIVSPTECRMVECQTTECHTMESRMNEPQNYSTLKLSNVESYPTLNATINSEKLMSKLLKNERYRTLKNRTSNLNIEYVEHF